MHGGVIFDVEAGPDTADIRFTAYFERNLRELKAPLPLTIFNKTWQDEAIVYHSKKKAKLETTDLEKQDYTGWPYPSEYTQSYLEWFVDHQGFHTVLIRICDYQKFAGWLLTHRRITDQIVIEDGFMTRLRYDINVWMNALARRVTLPDGRVSMANILILNKEIAQKAYGKARRYNELEFTENPYVLGGCRGSWGPATGKPPMKAVVGENKTVGNQQLLVKAVSNYSNNHQSSGQSQRDQEDQPKQSGSRPP
ncbi:hypothetical protein MJO28_012350 [Puccinia striiformis f. sp. tritici]|uniref:Uncharacterized protein n=2 Tax=Puccinia striiformis TaxID=27350 RepID=A0A2S4W7C9_9BASI|nr:hypothetical protein Pst134EB_023628 [Puccinia striiformis f. sp. tritici]KAI7942323.1 hypothetical protein MJO28_012350 [Puccinia striiformis f. sp. tritici]KAI7945688.1 hypothetical protein MJO29_012076 [Puccinia striiformis f. sp. tritici]POW17670.1 hypothetical protein PSTT_00513 [Puccinia striiformis]